MDIQRVETYMKRVAESETKTFTPVGDKLKVGLDLGTAYIVTGRAPDEEKTIPSPVRNRRTLYFGTGVVVDYLGALNIVKSSEGKTGAANWKRTGKLCHCYAGRNRRQRQDTYLCGGRRGAGSDCSSG